MALIKVKFAKAHWLFSYFAGDIGYVTPENAEMLLNGGYALPLPDDGEADKVNPLPEDMPARDILFDQGFDSVDKVKEAGDSLTDIKGIGKGTLKQLAAWFDNNK
jgi:hypothetical protein